jgi:hypothetical protein
VTVKQDPSRVSSREISLRAVAWALLFLIVGVGGDYIADRFGLQRDLLYLNDLISTIFIAILIVIYERRRRKRVEERLEVIREMNHHVRNALQLISFSHHAAERDEQLDLIQQAVARIEWALQEVLPSLDPRQEHLGPVIDPQWKRPTR